MLAVFLFDIQEQRGEELGSIEIVRENNTVGQTHSFSARPGPPVA